MKRRFLSPFAITQILMAALAVVTLWLAYVPWRWGKIKEEAHALYPSVKRIEGHDLQKWIVERSAAPPLLLDIRSAAEFEVSHLPGARHMNPGAPLGESRLLGEERSQIVVYDTVGYDAAAYALSLMRRNFLDVQVLEGGIFLWANEDRPMAGREGPATKVLPGLSEHTPLLERARRAP